MIGLHAHKLGAPASGWLQAGKPSCQPPPDHLPSALALAQVLGGDVAGIVEAADEGSKVRLV